MAFIDESIVRAKRNELFDQFAKAWESAPFVIDESGPFFVVYSMRDGDKIPDDNKERKPWARVTLIHRDARATSISGRRYKNVGDFIIQVFVSQDTTDSGFKVELLADYLKDWFRRYRGNVLLKFIRVQTEENNSGYSAATVISEFEYYEVNKRDNNAGNVGNREFIFDDRQSPLSDDNNEPYRV